jgi:hypothetical protein
MHGRTALTLVINNVYVPATRGWLETELSSARLVAEYELTGRYPSRAVDKRVKERYRPPDRSWRLAMHALYRWTPVVTIQRRIRKSHRVH